MSLTQVGRYQIIEELGRGAMGIVYRGFDPMIGRTVAIKTVQLDAGDPELLKRFRREAQSAGVLSHPNIVTVYDAGEDQGLFYIAMELVEGETLQKMLLRGPIPVEQAIPLVEQIAAALDHAHGHNIVHRDVKPANIVVSGAQVKVMDFGIAKLTGSTMTSTGQVLGTPSYMSPEAVKGLSVDGRSDIFSLGVILYEMLTGMKPFAGDNVTTVIYKIIGEQPEPPCSVRQSLDTGLNYVVLKALAKNPIERYQNCAELAADARNHAAYRARGREITQAAASQGGANMANGNARAIGAGPLKGQAAPEAHATVTAVAAAGSTPVDAADSRTMLANRAPLAAPPAVVTGGAAAAAPPLAPAQRPRGQRRVWMAGVTAGIVVVAGVGGGLFWKARRAAAPQPPAMVQQAAPAAVPALVQQAPPATVPATPAAAPPASSEAVAPAQASKPAARATRPGAAGSPVRAKTVSTPAPAAAPPTAAAVQGEGRLSVRSTPRGASISVDGKPTPYRTPVNFSLPAGKHSITIEHRGFGSDTRDVTIRKDDTALLDVPLAPAGEKRRRFLIR